MFLALFVDNDATEGEGGGIFLGANNTAIINKAVLSCKANLLLKPERSSRRYFLSSNILQMCSDNFAKDGGAIYAVENNTLTMIDCVLSGNLNLNVLSC